MVHHIARIANIGHYDQIAPGAQLPFEKFTCIYAENGRGKTTLTAILSSMASGEPGPIIERHRLGAGQSPDVEMTMTGGTVHRFQNGAWSATAANLAVFDDTFVAENVCSGLDIDASHRKNMHELILGAQGVALNAAVQTAVATVELHNRELQLRVAAIPEATRGPFNVDQFCGVQADPDIQNKIVETERQIAAVQSAAAIAETPGFEEVWLPSYNAEQINGLLDTSIDGLEEEAVERVQAHIAEHGAHAAAWIESGLAMVTTGDDGTETCPFCKQEVTGLDLIAKYRSYFGAAYRGLRDEIAAAVTAYQAMRDVEGPANFERAARTLSQRRDFWARYTDMPLFEVDTAEVVRLWGEAHETVGAALERKQAALLEKMALGQHTLEAIEAYEQARVDVLNVWSQFVALNDALDVLKEQAQAGDLAALRADLGRLGAIAHRYEAATATACQLYLDEKVAKQATEVARDAARAQLDAYRANVFPQYENAINDYLQRFSAGFRLQNLVSVNNRGGSSAEYAVLINQTAVPLIANGAPSFKTTLSAGDRNTLALAFFFASLDQDPNLRNLVVVIDDPLTSLDDNRTLVTIHELKRLELRVRQLVVLSHSKGFMINLWGQSPKTPPRSALKIVRTATGSAIEVWDVNMDSVTEHDRRFVRVQAYVQAPNQAIQRQVAMDLRFMLEQYVRVVFPAEFPPGSMLGQFLNTCRGRAGQANQLLNANDTAELQAILDYANRFHHDSNPNADVEHINDQVLQGFCLRTLAFIRR